MSASTISPDRAAELMRHAVRLARQGRGPSTAPNPCVAALLVKDGEIMAEGWHQVYGGPHAEVLCLADAKKKGVNPADCSLFVTLEPCNHHGKTPPCSKAVVEAGIKEVFIGTLDPNPVAEGGAEYLRSKGVTVHVGVEEQRCMDLISDFLTWQTTDRPYVIVKMAATLDGKIATRTGHSKWISGEESRHAVHNLRKHCQAVIVGGGTLRADDPRLNVRYEEGAGTDPLAVVVTSTLPGPKDDLFLLRKRPTRTVFWTTQEAAASATARKLEELGVRVWGLDPRDQGLDLAQGLARLRQECGAWHVLCEGGGSMALSFIAAGLMNELRFYLAPKILGDEQAKNLFTGLSPETMDQALGLRLVRTRASGEDILLIYHPKQDG